MHHDPLYPAFSAIEYERPTGRSGSSPDLSAQGAVKLFVQRSNNLPNAKRMVIVENVRFRGSSPTGAADSIPRVIYHNSQNRLLFPKLLTDLCLPSVSRPAF